MALTKEQIDAARRASVAPERYFDPTRFANAIEAAVEAPLLARIAVLTAQVEQAAQPVYQVKEAFADDPAGTWRDVGESAFYMNHETHRRILYTAPPKAVPLTDAQREVLAYLDGTGPLDGIWYGDKHPTEQGAYWWRKRLWAAFGTPATVEKG